MRNSNDVYRTLSLAAILLFLSCEKNPNSTDDTLREWRLLGLEDVEITAIAVDPSDENIIYAGGWLHGLFKSNDRGASWDTLFTGNIRDIDIHPITPQTLYVVGGNLGLVNKTTDGGQTWVAADSGLRTGFYPYVDALVIDPHHPDTLYVVARRYLNKSTDGGLSWLAFENNILNGWLTTVTIDPNNTDVIYVGTDGEGDIGRITEGGMNWERLDSPYLGIIYDLLVHSSNSDIVYAGTHRYGFYLSTDAGTSWVSANTGLQDTTWVYRIGTSITQIYIAAYSEESAVYESSQDSIHWTVLGNHVFEGRINTVFVSKIGTVYAGTTFGIYAY